MHWFLYDKSKRDKERDKEITICMTLRGKTRFGRKEPLKA